MTIRPVLVAIHPSQLVEHVTAKAADFFLTSPSMTSSMSMPITGETLDDKPVRIVRRDGQIFVYHGNQANWSLEHFDFLP